MGQAAFNFSAEFFQEIEAASERGTMKALQAAKLAAVPEEQITIQDAMVVAGFKDQNSFNLFCKRNRILPVAIRAKRKYYLASQFLKINSPKGDRFK